MLHNARIKMVMDTVERLLVNTHIHVCTHAQCSLPLCLSFSAVVTVTISPSLHSPALMRPLEDTERERAASGWQRDADTEKNRHVSQEDGQHGGRVAIVLYLLAAHEKPSLSATVPETKATAQPAASADYTVCSWPHHKFSLLAWHFHVNPITLSLIDNYPALHDLWPQTQIKIQLKVQVCVGAACSALLSGSIEAQWITFSDYI